MKEILSRVEIWFKTHLPEVLDNLNPGATDSEIDDFEHQIQIELPSSFKELYKWHNGQNHETYPGLFYGLEFLSLKEISRHWQIWAELFDEGINKDIIGESAVPGKVQLMYTNKKWIPFAYDWGGNHLGIDLDPGKKGKFGQVINFGRDEDSKYVFADNLPKFLEWFITQLESGNYLIIAEDEGAKDFSLKNPQSVTLLDYWK
jgi:cell wall assembly regulator SMI1